MRFDFSLRACGMRSTATQHALREFSRIAAPNAKLAIVDWSPEASVSAGTAAGASHCARRGGAELEEGGWGVVKSDVVTDWTYIVVGQR